MLVMLSVFLSMGQVSAEVITREEVQTGLSTCPSRKIVHLEMLDLFQDRFCSAIIQIEIGKTFFVKSNQRFQSFSVK